MIPSHQIISLKERLPGDMPMDAGEAETAYRSVKAELDAKKITLDEFNRRVAELKYQDNAGTWWAVSPQDGSWLKWDGAAWVPAVIRTAPAAPLSPAQAVTPDRTQPVPAGKGLRFKIFGTLSGKLAAIALAFGLAAWFRFPYLCAAAAIILGIISLYISGNRRGAAAVIAVIAVALAVLAMVFDMYYYNFFPVNY
jgi:hypothetical protein